MIVRTRQYAQGSSHFDPAAAVSVALCGFVGRCRGVLVCVCPAVLLLWCGVRGSVAPW
jgi:hypothetical protein